MHPFVHLQFIVDQIELGKQAVFVKEIVADQPAARQGLGDDAVLLVIAADQEENLGLEGVAGAIGVEITEKRVLFEHFQQRFGGQGLRQHPRQGGLAHADDAFDRDVLVAAHVKSRRVGGDAMASSLPRPLAKVNA